MFFFWTGFSVMSKLCVAIHTILENFTSKVFNVHAVFEESSGKEWWRSNKRHYCHSKRTTGRWNLAIAGWYMIEMIKHDYHTFNQNQSNFSCSKLFVVHGPKLIKLRENSALLLEIPKHKRICGQTQNQHFYHKILMDGE